MSEETLDKFNCVFSILQKHPTGAYPVEISDYQLVYFADSTHSHIPPSQATHILDALVEMERAERVPHISRNLYTLPIDYRYKSNSPVTMHELSDFLQRMQDKRCRIQAFIDDSVALISVEANAASIAAQKLIVGHEAEIAEVNQVTDNFLKRTYDLNQIKELVSTTRHEIAKVDSLFVDLKQLEEAIAIILN
jgi:hypothetical protein